MATRDSRYRHTIPAPPSTGEALVGDLTKGGRPATEEERTRLAGLNADGVPQGLTQCPVCAEWRGECLDPNPVFAGQVMQVHCRCANDRHALRPVWPSALRAPPQRELLRRGDRQNLACPRLLRPCPSLPGGADNLRLRVGVDERGKGSGSS